MMKKLMLLLAVLLLAMPVVAAETNETAKVAGGDCAQDVRPAVKTVFEQGKADGKSLDEIVAEAIKLGPNLCGVLVVADELDYDQESVLLALQSASIANNVIARAAMDAGYDVATVTRVVGQEELAGLGYTGGTTQGAAVNGSGAVGGGGRNSGTVSTSAVQ